MFSQPKATGGAGLSKPELWARLRVAPLPATRDGRDFATTLAILMDLPMAEARDLTEEYRRFLYLAAKDDAVRVPPAQIRVAWQVHAHSSSYERFCEGVLGRQLPLDDVSRRLGATAAYSRTRADYCREFNERPPRFFWPEGIKPRLPRWLLAHAGILGFAYIAASNRGEPLVFAIGLGASLALYGIDLWASFRSTRKDAFGDSLTGDLDHFLSAVGR